jgi:hypothetical protein
MAQEMKSNVVQAYKDACDNLIYLKKEQFQITYYTWLVLAALYILSSRFTPGKLVLFYGTLVVALVSILTLFNLQHEIERFCKRLSYIYAEYFEKDDREGLGFNTTTRHWVVTVMLSLTSAVAAGFTAWAIYGPDTPSGPTGH